MKVATLHLIKAALNARDFKQAFKLIEESVAVEQTNPYLWNLRADVIQLLDIPDGPPLLEVEKSYLKALEINPEDLESIESLAHYYDAVSTDIEKSKRYAALYLNKASKTCAAMDAILRGK